MAILLVGRDMKQSGAIDERALVEKAKQDREAFGQLYELHVERIYSYIYYRTSTVADAEDLTAKVFFRALQHIENYEDQGVPFSAWLYRIARNLLANWYRDNSKRQMVSLDSVAELHLEDSPEMAAELLEDRETLLVAIRRLPADRQELLILKHVEQLTNAEIGQILGRSEGAIKSLYFRTLRALQVDLTSRPTTSEDRDELPAIRRWLQWPRRRD
ncbi:MAG: sigma-70 family RNA polymerase sigma factor [Candidatus Promineifilaceae bacterium]|nr:sigma-70 family RNA polymerase sigma factor [Candidatus Promineifilaceae bacterium]